MVSVARAIATAASMPWEGRHGELTPGGSHHPRTPHRCICADPRVRAHTRHATCERTGTQGPHGGANDAIRVAGSAAGVRHWLHRSAATRLQHVAVLLVP